MLNQLLENLSAIREHSDYVAGLLNSNQVITCQLLKNNYTRIIKGEPKHAQRGILKQITDTGTSISEAVSYHDWVQDEREIEQSGEDDWR